MSDFPDIQSGMRWSQTRARQWRNAMGEVAAIAGLTVTSPLMMSKGGRTMNVSLDPALVALIRSLAARRPPEPVGGAAERFKLNRFGDERIMADDYVYATRLSTDDSNIKVAKPYGVQKTPWHGGEQQSYVELFQGRVSYTYSRFRSDEREAQRGDPPHPRETQIVWPEYPAYHPDQPDSYIWAARVGDGPGGTGIAGVLWQDMNIDNRQFIAVPLGLIE